MDSERGWTLVFWSSVILLILTLIFNAGKIESDLTGRARLALEKNGLGWIEVVAHGRDLVLSGTAPVAALKDLPVAVVRSVRGVRKVTSEIKVRPPEKPYIWSAERQDGAIRLRGFVPDEKTRGRLLAETARITGTPEPEDEMKLADGAPDSGWGDQAVTGVRVLEHMKSGHVSLTDHVLTVSGVAASRPGYQEILRLIKSAEATGSGYRHELKVRAPAIRKPEKQKSEKEGKPLKTVTTGTSGATAAGGSGKSVTPRPKPAIKTKNPAAEKKVAEKKAAEKTAVEKTAKTGAVSGKTKDVSLRQKTPEPVPETVNTHAATLVKKQQEKPVIPGKAERAGTVKLAEPAKTIKPVKPGLEKRLRRTQSPPDKPAGKPVKKPTATTSPALGGRTRPDAGATGKVSVAGSISGKKGLVARKGQNPRAPGLLPAHRSARKASARHWRAARPGPAHGGFRQSRWPGQYGHRFSGTARAWGSGWPVPGRVNRGWPYPRDRLFRIRRAPPWLGRVRARPPVWLRYRISAKGPVRLFLHSPDRAYYQNAYGNMPQRRYYCAPWLGDYRRWTPYCPY